MPGDLAARGRKTFKAIPVQPRAPKNHSPRRYGTLSRDFTIAQSSRSTLVDFLPDYRTKQKGSCACRRVCAGGILRMTFITAQLRRGLFRMSGYAAGLRSRILHFSPNDLVIEQAEIWDIDGFVDDAVCFAESCWAAQPLFRALRPVIESALGGT